MPKFVFKKITKTYLSFTVKETNLSFTNSLRRILLSEIPIVALDIINVEQNNTVLPDDLIVHRLGLVPMQTSKDLKYSKDCFCENFCDDCSIKANIKVFNNTNIVQTVRSSDIQCMDASFSDAVIAKLAPTHCLIINAIARKGTGMINAKFCPVTVVEYEYDKFNEKRHTKYWCEESVEKEWPGVQEKSYDINKKIDTVDMGMEVLEGYGALDILVKGLEVMDKKVVDLLDMIENYQS